MLLVNNKSQQMLSPTEYPTNKPAFTGIEPKTLVCAGSDMTTGLSALLLHPRLEQNYITRKACFSFSCIDSARLVFIPLDDEGMGSSFLLLLPLLSWWRSWPNSHFNHPSRKQGFNSDGYITDIAKTHATCMAVRISQQEPPHSVKLKPHWLDLKGSLLLPILCGMWMIWDGFIITFGCFDHNSA